MAKSGGHLQKARASLTDSIGDGVRKNANLVTGFVAVVILVAGAGLMNGRENWWISGLAIAALFLAIFLYLNARVLIKATLTTLGAVFLANFALQGGILFDPRSTVGLVWMSAQLFLYVGLISISYLITGHRSRWTGALLASGVALFSAAAMSEALSMLPAIGVSMVLGLGVFMLYYRYSGKLMEHRTLMPTHVQSDEVEEAVYAAATDAGWHARKLSSKTLIRKKITTDYLVWNEQHAYVLHPVELESKFAVSPSRKAQKLVHRGASLNPWLLNLVNKRLPLWRTRNASMMLVLLDVKSTNGIKAEAIGVSLPDTAKKLPVGIYPAKGMLAPSRGRGKKSRGVLDDIDSNYGDFLTPLTEKQRNAMSEIGLQGESEYIEVPSHSQQGA